MLADPDTLKALLGIAGSTYDVVLESLVTAGSAAVKTYCKRDFESTAYTEYYSGSGERDLVLRQRPVTAVTSVYADETGYYGDGPNAFAANKLLVAGSDYVLVRDGGSTSASGLLRRLSEGIMGEYGWWPPTFWNTRGSLVGRRLPVWPGGTGNIKVVYTAGYTTVPADVQQACLQLATWFWNTRKRGGVVLQQESMGQYSYQIAQLQNALNVLPELGTTRQLLAAYREQPV